MGSETIYILIVLLVIGLVLCLIRKEKIKAFVKNKKKGYIKTVYGKEIPIDIGSAIVEGNKNETSIFVKINGKEFEFKVVGNEICSCKEEGKEMHVYEEV